jgi:ribonuclease HII
VQKLELRLKPKLKLKKKPKKKLRLNLKIKIQGGPVDHLLFYPKPVIGVDEVGRGCLAGDVYAAAVILDQEKIPEGLKDSKKLSATRREELSALILRDHRVSIGIAEVAEIEELNILQASLLAMARAVEQLQVKGHILVDGIFPIPGMKGFSQTTIIQGDSRALPVAAASIVAKVARDHEMQRLDQVFPQYGFAKHKGYSTLIHKNKIKLYGPCILHRRTFSGVKEYVQASPKEGSVGRERGPEASPKPTLRNN